MSDPDMDVCAICCVTLDRIGRLSCGHGYHPTCIVDWLIRDKKHECPLCRRPSTDLCRLQKEVTVGAYESLLESKVVIEDPLNPRTKVCLENLTDEGLDVVVRLMAMRMITVQQSFLEKVLGKRTSLQFIPTIHGQRSLHFEIPWVKYTSTDRDALNLEIPISIMDMIERICVQMGTLTRIALDHPLTPKLQINHLSEFIAFPSKQSVFRSELSFSRRMLVRGEGKFIAQPIFQEFNRYGRRHFECEFMLMTGILVPE